jgi:DNA-binding CsgD family transcriptional regulator
VADIIKTSPERIPAKAIDGDELCGYLLLGLRRFNARLSDREWGVVACVFMGMDRALIGKTLNISVPAVKRHSTTIFRKLKVRGTVEIVALAYKHSLLYPSPNLPGNEVAENDGTGIQAAMPTHGVQQADRYETPAAEVLLGRVPAERRPRDSQATTAQPAAHAL